LRPTLAVENLQRSGWLFIKPAIQLLMPYCRLPSGSQPANGLEWENIARCWQRFRRENWGTTFLIAKGFCKILSPDTALLLPLHRNPTVRTAASAFGNHPGFS